MKATIQIGGKEIIFFDVHLDAHIPDVRKYQLEALAKELPSGNNERIIIAGDFNIDTKYALSLLYHLLFVSLPPHPLILSFPPVMQKNIML